MEYPHLWKDEFDLCLKTFQEDLTGAATAIFRLQDVYKLNTKDLSNGKIFDVGSNQNLSGQRIKLSK